MVRMTFMSPVAKLRQTLYLASMTVPIYRFAPSPNGDLHLGHAYSALFTEGAARRASGTFLLRIEDIDILRCRAHFATRILEDLAWLGLEWESPVLFQSRRRDAYVAAQSKLADMGLLYPCFCSRQAVTASARAPDPDGKPLYSGACRRLSPQARQIRIERGEPFALRMDMQQACARVSSPLFFHDLGMAQDVQADPRRWGDVILARKDIGTSYHIAVVVDDAYQGVTHVTRGMDLYESTHIHRLLQALLDLPFPVYHHHRLITDDLGRKLAKSARDPSLRSLRQAGVSAQVIRETLGLD
jgi:glutamyl-Q tRNA(Asp) synthetase